MDHQELTSFRKEKDGFLRRHPQSPLPHELRHDFPGLPYFEPNPKLELVLDVTPADGSPVRIATSDGQERTYRRAGKVHFEVGGGQVELTLLSTPGHDHGYFLPFRDATSGKETYGAGRYLDVPRGDNGQVVVDFNYSYSPYCAYSDAYSCALPPRENRLTVPIEAGEMDLDSQSP